MSADQHTSCTFYLGRAAADLDPTQTTLQVIVPELLPAALSGSFAAGTTKVAVKLNTLTGGQTSVTPTTANHIVAVWDGNSNFAYPPFVKAGEQVDVIQYGDSDRYYWRAKGRDRDLRQQDRVRLEVSATANKNTPKNDSNTYFVELDAVAGYVQIKTSKANKEPFAYGIKIDTTNGIIVISDDIAGTPNRIYLESGINGGVPKIQLNNAKNATVQLVGEDIIIKAPRDILIQAGRQIIQTAPTATMNWNIGVINGSSLGVVASESMVVTSPTFDVGGNAKITGTLVTTTVRSAGYYTGALGSTVVAPSTNPNAGTSTLGGNQADTTIPTGQRHAAAYENILTMAQAITSAFNQVEVKIGVPIVGTTITDAATASEMINNAGT